MNYKLIIASLLVATSGSAKVTLPKMFSDGMVMQRDRYLPVGGTADAGSRITVTLAGHTYKTTTDNCGRWAVTALPLQAGGPYEMTVSDGQRTLRFTDILAGEVWIASGQSNMEFPLRDATGAQADIADSADPQLRFYDMKAIARTNNEQWPDSIIEAMDRLGHFKPTTWSAVGSGTAGDLSAVAYYFARQLRDSLHVPVGIISNAVGGAPCESWIDVTTLEHGMPEILINWRTNDYVQPWAQGRANVIPVRAIPTSPPTSLPRASSRSATIPSRASYGIRARATPTTARSMSSSSRCWPRAGAPTSATPGCPSSMPSSALSTALRGLCSATASGACNKK